MVFEDRIRVIHGHLPVAKYAHLARARRITFLRHPVSNLISIYHFWKQIITDSHCLFNYFRANNLGVLELARLPHLRYLLSRTYFGDVDVRSFDFIRRTTLRPSIPGR